jgi:hypothetical protein
VVRNENPTLGESLPLAGRVASTTNQNPELPQSFATRDARCLDILPTREVVFVSKTNPTGASDDDGVEQASQHDLAPRYARVRRREKSQLLDEFV